MTIDLFSTKSIEKAIKDLEKKKSDLQDKCEQLVKELSDLGKEVAIDRVEESPLGNTIVISSKVNPQDVGCQAVIMAVGKVYSSEKYADFYTLLAVEYGAGIHYNQKANPKAKEFGYGVGTFPEQMHAFEDGWYYLGNDGKYHYSHGVKAAMPMYSAEMEILKQYEKIGRRIFTWEN